MKKLLLTSLLFLVFTDISNVSQEKGLLSKVLERLEAIESASYVQSHYTVYPDDTVRQREYKRLTKEYNLPSDTSVGAAFAKLHLDDTTRMDNAYDGTIKARVDWEEYHYETSDFTKSRWPYRVVVPPFFARAKAIINYVLNTSDSLVIQKTDLKDATKLKISIYNERIEFVGMLPIHITQLGSNEGFVSEYILWINKKSGLPFQFQRTLGDNAMAESIEQIQTNNLNIDNFSISNYIPQDMPKRGSANKFSSDNLINSIAQPWDAVDLKGQPRSSTEASSKVYMLNFTSMYCGPCKLSIPFLNDLGNRFDKNNFDFVSLYQNSEKKSLSSYLKRNAASYHVFLTKRAVFKEYRAELFPTFMILDSDRKIRKIIHGFKEGETEAEIEKAIKDIL
ncbi:TlpA family protein disulfide reductase [Roseivirga misakiensis]|uniref:Thioredoxin domain-containing protein n=1 Tax=Roseivirga misakiensis TaxID=1563681 RepID=A0A1E5SYQ9_9BACT|nr:TlpA disulfide reductase family protein [Roseivirga misakiensis]OEK04259.1 hypothetical protein BFP71_12305 [Roseivirga misakiensis]